MGLNVLDAVMSADNKIKALREQDLPELRDQLEQQHQALTQALTELTQQVQGGGGMGGQPSNLLGWPELPAPVGKDIFDDADGGELESIMGTLAAGPNRFNFATGEVQIAGQRTEQMSQALSEMDAQSVRSVHIVCPSPYIWWIPGENTGRYMEQSFTVSLDDIEAKELVIKPERNTAHCHVIASTSPTVPMDFEGQTTGKPLAGVDPRNVSSETIDVDDARRVVEWTSASEVRKDSPLTESTPYMGHVPRVGFVVRNRGNNPIQLTIQGQIDPHDLVNPDDFRAPRADLPGWSNLRVEAGTFQTYTVDFPFRELQVEFLTVQNNVTSEMEIDMMGVGG